MIRFENYVNISNNNSKLKEAVDHYMEPLNERIHFIGGPDWLTNQLTEMYGREYWMKTDPINPPFKVGQKVWIEASFGLTLNAEDYHYIREPQIVEDMMPIPCHDCNLWGIGLKDCDLILTSQDIRLI